MPSNDSIDESIDIGPALRFLRLHGALRPAKQKDVAARAGITKGMLSAYERGKRLPSLLTLWRLLFALDADLVELQWALRMVGAAPGSTASADHPVLSSPERSERPETAETAAAVPVRRRRRWQGASEVAESSPPYGDYRVVHVPEPLSEDEEEALGQMLAGFLAYLRYTRSAATPPDAEDSGEGSGGGAGEGDEADRKSEPG